MKIKIEDYEIICDTREQDTLIQDTLIKKGIKTAREKLDMYYPNEKVYMDQGM